MVFYHNRYVLRLRVHIYIKQSDADESLLDYDWLDVKERSETFCLTTMALAGASEAGGVLPKRQNKPSWPYSRWRRQRNWRRDVLPMMEAGLTVHLLRTFRESVGFWLLLYRPDTAPYRDGSLCFQAITTWKLVSDRRLDCLQRWTASLQHTRPLHSRLALGALVDSLIVIFVLGGCSDAPIRVARHSPHALTALSIW